MKFYNDDWLIGLFDIFLSFISLGRYKRFKKKIERLEEEIKNLAKKASRDSLTGLLNRGEFLKLAEGFFNAALAELKFPGRRKNLTIQNFSILFFDINGFKEINDQYGHMVGDQVLRSVSLMINNQVRSSDLICRWGGDEIVVALIGSNGINAQEKAKQIEQAVKEIKIKGKSITLSISTGVAETRVTSTLLSLIDEADREMYIYKNK